MITELRVTSSRFETQSNCPIQHAISSVDAEVGLVAYRTLISSKQEITSFAGNRMWNAETVYLIVSLDIQAYRRSRLVAGLVVITFRFQIFFTQLFVHR
jgi:hypothetical protein